MGLRKLDTTGTWKVNDDPIYVPDVGIPVAHSHLAAEDSGRDEAGYMHIVWLRPDVRKVTLLYGTMTGSELAYMRARMQGKEFTLTYANEDSVDSFKGYCGEVSAELYTRINNVDIYKDVKITVTEL